MKNSQGFHVSRPRRQSRRVRRGRPGFEWFLVQAGRRKRSGAHHGREAESRLQLEQWQFSVGDGDLSRVYAAKPLDELAATVREVVAKEFKQAPDTIVLAFSLSK